MAKQDTMKAIGTAFPQRITNPWKLFKLGKPGENKIQYNLHMTRIY